MFHLPMILVYDIIPSLTVIKCKNRCKALNTWLAAVLLSFTDYGNLLSTFTFFLNGFHLTFCYELIISSEVTDIVEIICDFFSFV